MITPSYGLTATERVLPKLALDFTTASLDSRVTLTRSLNTATCVNSSGYISIVNANLPRFDYDPVTLVCKGLLIEESRINLLTYSEAFNNAVWVGSNATVSSDVAVSPSGNTDADKLIESATTSAHSISQSVSYVNGTAYTISFYAKAGERSFLAIQPFGGSIFAYFNLSNGTVGTTGGSPTATSIKAAGNGWYRCSITATAPGASSLILYVAAADGTASYAGNGTSGIYLYGGQVEAGAFPTSYIPNLTTGTTTRNADVATMTGTNFSSWYNASEGSIQFSFIKFGTTASTLTIIQNAAQTSYWNIQSLSAFTAKQDTTGNLSNTTVAGASNTLINTCFAIKDNSSIAALNGTLTMADTSGTVPAGVDRMSIGYELGGAKQLNGWMKKISYWPQRLTNAEVQAFSK